MKSASDIRAIARGILHGRWTAAVLVGISAFLLGIKIFNLRLIDQVEAKQQVSLFGRFINWKTIIVSQLLRVFYIILWSLLLIIPGIMAAYSYAMTGYILAEHPGMTAKEALARSRELMAGKRFHLFCLQFSFIGWAILCLFTMGIGFFWLSPYFETSITVFYREISGREIIL